MAAASWTASTTVSSSAASIAASAIGLLLGGLIERLHQTLGRVLAGGLIVRRRLGVRVLGRLGGSFVRGVDRGFVHGVRASSS